MVAVPMVAGVAGGAAAAVGCILGNVRCWVVDLWIDGAIAPGAADSSAAAVNEHAAWPAV